MSDTGRGFRLHETDLPDAVTSVRQAILFFTFKEMMSLDEAMCVDEEDIDNVSLFKVNK